jgi:hypothetical protein
LRSRAKDLTTRLGNDDRDEDRGGPSGFEDKAARPIALVTATTSDGVNVLRRVFSAYSPRTIRSRIAISIRTVTMVTA